MMVHDFYWSRAMRTVNKIISGQEKYPNFLDILLCLHIKRLFMTEIWNCFEVTYGIEKLSSL